jgi:hypothetical protein
MLLRASERAALLVGTILRLSVIDLSIPRQRCGPYAKGAYRRLLQELRYLLFGNRSAKLTCQRCEAFYEDASHFD